MPRLLTLGLILLALAAARVAAAPTAGELYADLASVETATRVGAATALRDLDLGPCGSPDVAFLTPSGVSPEVLMTGLRDPNRGVRAECARLLGRITPKSARFAKALLDLARDEDLDVRTEAVVAYWLQSSERPDELFEVLIAGATDADSANTRWRAACLLGRWQEPPAWGKFRPRVEAALIGALRDLDPSVRAWAADSLGQAADDSPELVQAFLQALTGSQGLEETFVVTGLVALTERSPSALQGLLRVLQDGDQDVDKRLCIAHHLEGCSDSALGVIVPVLVPMLSSPDKNTRAVARYGLKAVATTPGRGDLSWVLLALWWRELCVIGVVLIAWFSVARVSSKSLPREGAGHYLQIAVVALGPSLLVGGTIFSWTRREWVSWFLPDPIFTVIPISVAATLSLVLLCLIAAVGVCQRPPLEGPDPLLTR
jgi:HEAT repeat protein